MRTLLFLTFIVSVWSIYIWNDYHQDTKRDRALFENAILKKAETAILSDQTLRHWLSDVGGVYVKVSNAIQPNPNLSHVKNRDITTEEQSLTLVKPTSHHRKQNGTVHISATSLNPLSPENSPNKWEKKALRLFDKGEESISEFVECGDKRCFRLMKPIMAKKSCMKCHTKQGTKENGIYGGVLAEIDIEAEEKWWETVQNRHFWQIMWNYIFGLIFFTSTIAVFQYYKNKRQKWLNTLSESEAKFKTIFTASSDALMILSPTTREFVDINNAAYDLFKIDKSTNPKDLQHSALSPEFQLDGRLSEEKTSEMIETSLKNTTNSFEWLHCTTDGDPFEAQVLVTALEMDGHNCLLGSIRDISSLKSAEREILNSIENKSKLVQKLETKNKELNEFSVLVSHDLKSPVISIRGFSEIAMTALHEGDQKTALSSMERIQKAAKKIDTFCASLLELSKIGTMNSISEKIELKSLIFDVVDQVDGLIKKHNVKLTLDIDNTVVTGNETRLTQVVQNLIENAIKFSQKDLPLELSISSKSTDNEVEIYFKDNGIGIDQRHLKRIFNMFSKLDPSSNGIGHGLAFVKKVVETHNGTIKVDSKGAGHGTTFTITLPRT